MKNTFFQRPAIALQHIKNSAWAIEKLHSKTCVRKGFLRVIYTTIARVTQAQFLPHGIETKFKAKNNSLVHGFIPRDYTPAKINRFNYTSAEKLG